MATIKEELLVLGIKASSNCVVTDFIYRAVQVLKENLYWIRISAQDAGLMELVELWDEG